MLFFRRTENILVLYLNYSLRHFRFRGVSISKKEFIMILFAVQFISGFYAVYCTYVLHVSFIELPLALNMHLAIASAGFFVSLASLPLEKGIILYG